EGTARAADRKPRIDMLETLDDSGGTIRNGAILDVEPLDGDVEPVVLARGARRGHARRSGDAGGEPIDPTVGQALEIDLGFNQDRAAHRDIAGEQRPKRQLHIDRTQPYHVADRGAR